MKRKRQPQDATLELFRITRQERAELRKQQDRADLLIDALDAFVRHFRPRPIGFDTFHVLTMARTFTDLLSQYHKRIEDKLAYKKRRRRK